MAEKSALGVGLLGLGVIGSHVASRLLDPGTAAAFGRPVELRRALVRRLDLPRSVALPDGVLTDDFADVLEDDGIDVVVEAMGGEHPALNHLTQLLSQGVSVVTANKEVVAKHGPALMAAARSSGAHLRYEASVGGGIPIIGPLQDDLLANDISSVRAIINGTTNYILTKMSQEGLAFGDALAQAQALGYAEPDPANDIEGRDAVYKLAILASLAFHTTVTPDQVHCEGITALEADDFQYAHELGYEIKLLAIAQRIDGAVQARVHPALLHRETMLAKVEGPFNAVEVEGDLVGPVVFHGRGAGPAPTASAIIGDLLACTRGEASDPGGSSPQWTPLPVRPMRDLETQYYLRISASDQPGVLAQIARAFSDHTISLASVIQKDADNQAGTADLVITTHPAREAAMQSALEDLKRLSVLTAVHNLLRVEAA
ncbi:MAG: homoserine dehydrogenase [Chloroflexi bacterium]|nr:homoserine dehydrogenase [Chloroflexota bacterium]